MKTICLDHNIVHYFNFGFPTSGYNETKEHQALELIRAHPDRIRIVFSPWNLVEASREHTDRVLAYGLFIDGLHPYWLLDRRNIQRLELKAYVYRELLGQPQAAEPVIALKHYFS